MRRALHKLATWLALVAFLLSGIAPAQALVLCFEADGRVTLEAVESRCEPCPSDPHESPVVHAVDDGCLCFDIPLPTEKQERQARLASSDLSRLDVAPPLPACLHVVPASPDVGAKLGWREPTRPPASLALIRTVVLRV